MSDIKHKSDDLIVMCCGPQSSKCKCECGKGGACEHKWDGPVEEFSMEGGGCGGSSTCSRCGMRSIDHDMWVLP
jgi:hypothetical protein